LAITYLAGCAGTDETGHNFRLTEEEGTAIAVTSGGPRYTTPLFTYEPILTLHEDPSREESMLFQPRSFVLGSDGCYYVPDPGNGRIAVFSHEGEFLRSFGGRGSGPGEFRMMELQWLDGDILSIFDYSQQRTTHFRSDGTLLAVITSPSGRLATWLDRTPNEVYVLGGIRGERNDSINSTERRAVLLEPSGRDTISVVRTGLVADFFLLHYEQNAEGTIMGGHSLPFAGGPIVKYVPGRGILVTDGERPELAWYDLNGQRAKIIKVEMEARPVTAELKQAYEARQIRRFRENAERTGRPMRQLPDYEYAEQIGFCRHLVVDDAGYIWCLDVERLDQHEPGVDWLYHVFDPEGRYLGTTELPTSRPSIADGLLMTFVEDPDTGEQVGTVFAIRPAVEGLVYPE